MIPEPIINCQEIKENYKWKKEDSKETKYGLIAQDVRKLLPDAVYEDTKGFLSVDYNCIWTLMLKSHQELIESHTELIKSHQELIESHNELTERVTKLEDLPKTNTNAALTSALNIKRHRPTVRARKRAI